MSDIKDIQPKVSELHLDLENYRIPEASSNEHDAMNYLFTHYDILKLAEEILRDGYDGIESLIVIEREGGGYVVIEGNRRVAALHAFRNPSAVPIPFNEPIQDMLRQYERESLDLPQVVTAKLYPSRRSSDTIVARLHTTQGRKSWSRAQQARFYGKRFEQGVSVEELSAEFRGVDISRHIKMAMFMRFLGSISYVNSSLEDYFNWHPDSVETSHSADSKASTLEYIYSKPEIAEIFGVRFAKDGTMLPSGKTPEQIAADLTDGQQAALEYLLQQVQSGELDTRSRELQAKSDTYPLLLFRLRSIRDEVDAVVDDSLPTEDARGEIEGNVADNEPIQAKPAGSRRTPHPSFISNKHLDLTGIDLDLAPAGLKRMLDELRRIEVPFFFKSTSSLMRSTLEAAAKHRFKLGETAHFAAVIDMISSHYSATNIKDQVNRLKSGTSTQTGSIRWFHAAVHNPGIVSSPEEVFDAWVLISTIIDRLLQDSVSDATQHGGDT